MPGVARMLCAGQEMIVYGRMKPYGKSSVWCIRILKLSGKEMSSPFI